MLSYSSLVAKDQVEIFHFIPKCYFSISFSTVRSKVSSWVSNFVCDMRIKSPAIINKWVDPTPIPSADCSLLHTNHSSIKNLGAQNCGRLEEFSAESNQISEKATEVEQNNIENILDTDASNTIEIPIISDNSQTDNKNKSKFGTKFWVNPAFLPNLYKKTRESSPDGDSNDISVTNSESKPAPSEKTEPNKSRIEEFYALLRINREHYSYMVNRSMEAKKLIKNAKEKLRSSSKGNAALDPNDDATNENVTDESTIPLNMAESSAKMDPNENLQLRDPTDMDVSTDEYSHFTQSNENISGDDSFNHSPMQSITGAPCSPTHLNVGRKLGIGEIGRSTSDNPRLRNKYLLGDIGRSFSEHQDDEAIMIGERNISAPTSSIAIQSKPNGGFFERRAYSVSPTQKGLRRGMLSRDQSLSESSKQRYSLTRDGSIQSDSSHCSSVESLLDARKPDPEAILRQLGFGPVQQEDLLSRIPKRLLSDMTKFITSNSLFSLTP